MKKLLLFAVAATVLGGCSLTSQIKSMGYTPIKPANNVPQPGSIVFPTSTPPLKLQIVCGAETGFPQPLRTIPSKGPVSKWKQTVDGSIKVEGEVLDRVKGKAGAKLVRKVEMQFSNVKIVSLPADEVMRQRKVGLPQNCIDTVNYFSDAGREMSMIYDALSADVVYKVTYDAAVDADAKIKIAEQIAPELGVGVKVSAEGEITGEGLIWGVKDDQVLLALYRDKPLAVSENRSKLWVGKPQKNLFLDAASLQKRASEEGRPVQPILPRDGVTVEQASRKP